MQDALWIDRCAAQFGRRWPSIEAVEASVIAGKLVASPAWRELDPERAADSYVWDVEERHPVSPSAFVLKWHYAGASDEQLVRAVAAAEQVFRETGVTPAAAARGQYRRACWDDGGFAAEDAPPDDALDAASAWDDAEGAAFDVCRNGSEFAPAGAGIELLWRRCAPRGADDPGDAVRSWGDLATED